MKPSTYPIATSLPGGLVIMPKPSGEWLEDDTQQYRALGINTIVSMLEHEEEIELDLQNERAICEQNGINFVQLCVEDRKLPAVEPFADLIEQIVSKVKNGELVAVHCRTGIGRSGIVVCCVLLHFGYTPASSIELVTKARGVRVPDTQEQRDFIDQYDLSIK